MTWKELARVFNEKFGPTNEQPVFVNRCGALSEDTGIAEFLELNILTVEAREQVTKAHCKATVFIDRFKSPYKVYLVFTMQQDHPQRVASLADANEKLRVAILTISRKKISDGKWGVCIKEAEQSDDQIEVATMCGEEQFESLTRCKYSKNGECWYVDDYYACDGLKNERSKCAAWLPT